ncbi:hypothetical protein Tco_0613873 [Tanacetum coccineum]
MVSIGDRVIGGLKTSMEVFTIIGNPASKNGSMVKSITQCEVRMVIAIHHHLREKKGSNLATSLKQIYLGSGSGVTNKEDSSITEVESRGSRLLMLLDVAVYYRFAISTFPVKIVIRSSAFILEYYNYLLALEKDIFELKKDDHLKTQVTALVDEHLDARLGATKDEFMNYLSALITARITKQVKNQLPQILPKEVSNFAPPVIQSMIMIDKMDKSESYLAATEHIECYEGLIKSYDLDKTLFSTYDKVFSLKRSRKDKDKDEDPSVGLDQGLKKRKTIKDAEPKKSIQLVEPEFVVIDLDMPQDQEENPGNDDEEPKEKVASKCDWFTKPTQPQEPIDPDWNVRKTPKQGKNQSWLMTLASSADKPSKIFDELISTPIDFFTYIMNGIKITNLTQETLLGPAFRLLKGTHSNYVKLEYDFEECYKALSEKLDWANLEGEGVSTMTYITSITKTKATQYDLPGIEDIVPNIWVPVKVAYDKHALWGISHWIEQRKTFYGYARGLQSTHDVSSIKHILAVTLVEVMRKHRYGYLKEIVVRRADNNLYRSKEGDFPHLRINDIEDMLLLVVQNRLTNLLSDDVSDFTIALRMFTKSLVIQKRVKDLQLGVKSYEKKINITKPETTKSDIRKRDPYTPYQDPQGFIYADNNRRNRLMRSDELYKFSDRTLTGL